MKTILSAVQAFIADEDGVTAIEYGLIAALVGVVMAGVAATVGDQIKETFQRVSDELGTALGK